MEEDDGAQLLGPRPETLEARIREFRLAHVGADLQAAEAETLHAVLELLYREFRLLHRHRSKRDEAIGVPLALAREVGLVERASIEIERRRQSQPREMIHD